MAIITMTKEMLELRLKREKIKLLEELWNLRETTIILQEIEKRLKETNN